MTALLACLKRLRGPVGTAGGMFLALSGAAVAVRAEVEVMVLACGVVKGDAVVVGIDG